MRSDCNWWSRDKIENNNNHHPSPCFEKIILINVMPIFRMGWWESDSKWVGERDGARIGRWPRVRLEPGSPDLWFGGALAHWAMAAPDLLQIWSGMTGSHCWKDTMSVLCYWGVGHGRDHTSMMAVDISPKSWCASHSFKLLSFLPSAYSCVKSVLY